MYCEGSVDFICMEEAQKRRAELQISPNWKKFLPNRFQAIFTKLENSIWLNISVTMDLILCHSG